MKKLIVIGSGAACAFAISAVLGTGVAAADDYAGQSYADASSAASDDGLDVVVASRVGDKAEEDDCLVVRSQDAPFINVDDDEFSHVEDTVQFYLNCNAGVASASSPGNSLASAAGREAREAEEAAAEEQAAEEELAAADE